MLVGRRRSTAGVVVGGQKVFDLHQIGRWWTQSALVRVMGHNNACGTGVASYGGPQGPRSVLALMVNPRLGGGRWLQVDNTPADRKVVAPAPADSRHRSC